MGNGLSWYAALARSEPVVEHLLEHLHSSSFTRFFTRAARRAIDARAQLYRQERVMCVPAHPDRDVFKMRHEQRAGPARHEGQAHLPFGERESGT